MQNNANEGPTFTPQNIVTEDDFVNFLRNTFPLFTIDDISRVLLYYPSTNASVDMSTPEFATSGNSTPTALNESTFGTGQQQRADVSTISLAMSYLERNATALTVLPERLRRNNLRLPILLARRSLHKPQPRSLQIPILRHRRLARIRHNILLRSAHAQPGARLQQSFHDHLGQLRHAEQPFDLRFDSQRRQRNGQWVGRDGFSGVEFAQSAAVEPE